ncbi:MAG: phospho-sugar mutase [Aminipila sp.]
MKQRFEAWSLFLNKELKKEVKGENHEIVKKINQQLIDELHECMNAKNADEEIYERFYKDVEFGTGGLRGILGVGTNRMNIYTVSKATQGIAEYINAGQYLIDSPLKNWAVQKRPSVAIAYDSRINSRVFAKTAAEVLLANDIDVYLFDELMPTPALSYAVRHFNCAMGIMITASHNPAKYNGYKVYDNSGCQVTLEAAQKIFSYIQNLDIFNDIKNTGGQGSLNIINKGDVDSYINAVFSESTGVLANNLTVVYTPLNGAGNKCVRAILDKIGVRKINIVEEQELPDGNFPTCPYPNPEKREALQLGLQKCDKLAKEAIAKGSKEDIPDLLLATDPDCDRIGIAVYSAEEYGGDDKSNYMLLTGNEVGVLLLDFMIKTKVKTDIKRNPCIITTIVSTKMAEAMALKHDIRFIATLTGFKFIGEQIGFLENEGREHEFLFGFEESYGYLSGSYVRDKDAVNGAMLICEMASYYKEKGMTLIERLHQLYEEFGYFKEKLLDFTFEGVKGMQIMSDLMKSFRDSLPDSICGKKIIQINDYEKGIRNLPKSDVVEIILEGGSSFIVRPSGTEPKIKIYLSAKGNTAKDADDIIEKLEEELKTFIKTE